MYKRYTKIGRPGKHPQGPVGSQGPQCGVPFGSECTAKPLGRATTFFAACGSFPFSASFISS